MLESKPPRNSSLETHPDDERGRWPSGLAPPSAERFPDALRNSYRKLRRSRFLAFGVGFKSSRGQVAQRRVQAFAVVHFFDKVRDRSLGFFAVAIGFHINLLAFQRFHETFGFG